MQTGKVLIIIREFIPYTHSLGSSIRVLKMAEFFRQNRMEVHLLAAKGEEIGFFGYESLMRAMRIHYVDDVLQRYITRRIRRQNMNGPVRRGPGEGILSSLKKIINEISIPDEGIYFVRRYVQKALEIIRDNQIRNVVVSSPAHSAQIIGMKVKERLGDKINLIVDYRDSWNTTRIFRKKTRISRFLSERMEGRVLKVADHFVYVTPSVLEKMNTKFFDISEKSLLVRNGYDAALKIDKSVRKAGNAILTIGHFGFISNREGSYRNPELFFRALLKMHKKIHLVLCGSVDISMDWQERLKDILIIRQHVPHKEALDLMQGMDLLLQLHSEVEGADEVVSGKIYEYILAEKPILAVGPTNMDASSFVMQEGLGYFIDLYDEDGMTKKMDEIYRKWEQGQLISYKSTDYIQFSRQHQYSKMLDILE